MKVYEINFFILASKL